MAPSLKLDINAEDLPFSVKPDKKVSVKKVMELFRAVAEKTQKGFGYEAGRSLDEKPPMSEFREDEFKEVVGLSRG